MIRDWLRVFGGSVWASGETRTPPADDGPRDVLPFPADRVVPQLRVLDLHDDDEPEPVRGFPRLYDPDRE